jgi:hypothetical protein
VRCRRASGGDAARQQRRHDDGHGRVPDPADVVAADGPAAAQRHQVISGGQRPRVSAPEHTLSYRGPESGDKNIVVASEK